MAGSEARVKHLQAKRSCPSSDFFAVYAIFLDNESEESDGTKTKSCGRLEATGHEHGGDTVVLSLMLERRNTFGTTSRRGDGRHVYQSSAIRHTHLARRVQMP